MKLLQASKILVTAAALAALSAPSFAITKNWSTDDVHTYVGLAVFYDEGGQFLWRCSGTLIGPTQFLTAGHCADTAGGAVSARIYFRQDAGANYDPATQHDPVTGYPDDCAGAVSAPPLCVTVSSGKIHNYEFADFAGFPDTRDVGLLILDQSVSTLGYGALPEVGALDGLGTARGTKSTVFTVSGYGVSYSSEPHSAVPNINYRSRLMAESTLVNLWSANNGGYNLQTQGNGDERGGTCSGDSGGPVFLGDSDSNLIVAVTSFGMNEICRGTDFSYRIDRSDVLEWINGFLAD